MLAVTFESSFGDKFMYQHVLCLYEKNEEMRMQCEKGTVIGEKA